MTQKKARFDIFDLAGFLGEFYDQCDVDAVIEEATYVDTVTMERYWIDEGLKNLWKICQKHFIDC